LFQLISLMLIHYSIAKDPGPDLEGKLFRKDIRIGSLSAVLLTARDLSPRAFSCGSIYDVARQKVDVSLSVSL